MKKLPHSARIVLFVIIGVSLAFLSAAFGSGATLLPSPNPMPTPTPTAVDINLEIGSTDGIFIWAVLILLIIIVPILWHFFLHAKKK